MNTKVIITAIFTLVAMTGQSKVHYRLEGFVGDSTITRKAYILDMTLLRGKIIDSVNITKGVIEPKEGGMGNGWQTVEMEVKIDGPTTLRYGVSAYPVFTQVPCHAKWFSAADFKLERVEEE